MEQENMEQENQFDWEAASRAVPIEEAEERAIETQEIVNTWREKTPEGQAFSRDYNTPENRKALLAGLEIIGEISWPTLTDTFRRLKENGKLHLPQAPPTQAQIDRDNRAKWEADCLSWYNDPARTTKEIRQRYETDPAFRAWVEQNRFEIAVEDATALQAEARVLNEPAESAGFHPSSLQWQRQSERLQREQDKRYLRIEQDEPGLHGFAEEVKKMSSQEYKRRLVDPKFKERVEKAAKLGLL